MTAQAVDDYVASFPEDVAVRLSDVRAAILAEVPEPEERVRYGIAAVMLGGRYALHFAGWKQHIGIYPVPPLSDALEAEVAPRRSGKDSVVFRHADPLPVELISRITREIVAQRAASGD
ncbi:MULTISPECIES: iron chaperone [unclassified Agromyces]|uniref:iron chaperone n=1 Tax=unclassified Agromyces TaxID=2639701 RepID=UPI003014C0BC